MTAKHFINSVKKISMEQAKAAMDKAQNCWLVDVRTREEYKRGHIPGSINIPIDWLDDVETIIKQKDAKIFVYCQSGKRSIHACYLLCQMGYTDVTDIGGIKAWPHPLVR